MKTDAHGNLFASGPEGVYLFASDGTYLGHVDLGRPTSNCAWGEDGSTLFITADTAVYRLPTKTLGAGWPTRAAPSRDGR